MPGRLSPMQVKFIKLPALIKRSGPPSTVTSGSENPSNVQFLNLKFSKLTYNRQLYLLSNGWSCGNLAFIISGITENLKNTV